MKVGKPWSISPAVWLAQNFERKIGDIVWARLDGYSFWPSVVTKEEKKPGRRYVGCVHIHFLGYENDVSLFDCPDYFAQYFRKGRY